MVYITGEDGIVRKFACKSCIKGHRSSGCQHSDREMVEIRKKGRPISQCAQCRNLRKTKQVHIKCMCHKKSEGNRKVLSKTAKTASSSSNSTPSPVTQPSPIPYNNTKNDHHNNTAMDNNELISQESQLQSLLTKTCTRCDRPQSYCICTSDNRSNSSEHDYFSSASSDGSVTPPISSPMDLQTITNNNNHSPIHRYHHHHNSLKIVIPSNFTNKHITNQSIKHNNNSNNNNNTIDTTTSTLVIDNNNNNNTNLHTDSSTSTITFNNSNNNNSSSYPTPNSNPHTSSILSPAGLHTLIPIHDPTDDLDSDTPIYKSEVQDIDRSEVLGKLNNTTSEELMHQIYNEFSAETQKLTHPPISFVVADDDDEHHHSHSQHSSGYHTPNTHSRKHSLDGNNNTDVNMNTATTTSSPSL